MTNKDRIISIVKQKGPILPIQVARELSTTTLMAAAQLSELVKVGQLKISNLKVGSSPLYYASGQEEKLQQYADKLNSKEKEAYELLKKEKVLRDSEQVPAIRAALRGIKDFAKGIEVTLKGNQEMFWKWYLTPREEVEAIIKKKLHIGAEEKKEKPQPQQPQETKARKEPAEQKPAEKPQEKKPPRKFVDQSSEDQFSKKVTGYFNNNNVEIIEKKVVRKNKEMDLVVSIPSPVGKLKYYCKAKSKNRVNDRDLSAAYAQGQIKKLPVLFLYTGELTKKAQEMLHREFESITLRKI